MIHWAHLLWVIPISVLLGVFITAIMVYAGQHRDDQ